MNTYKHFIPGLVLAGAFLLGLPIADAMARGGIEIGVLTCNSVEGTRRNLLIHSTVDVRCVFKTAEGEESYTGETVRWRNPDSGHSGTFTPTRTYRTADDRNCREYQTTVTVGGRNRDAYGTACRQGDGTWKITQ